MITTSRECGSGGTEIARRRATFIRRYFGENWKDASLCHLVIDSSIGFDSATEMIMQAAGLAPPQS